MSGRGDPAPERNGYHYPLYRRNERAGRAHAPGERLFLWDIDNTYLITEFESLRDLIRIRFESAEAKRPVPGAVSLLAGLRGGDDSPHGVFFVSASPETMRQVLEARMRLDGVTHDGITFRDLHRLRYLRDIYGFKLAALLLYRLENPPETPEALFGDDRERDPEIYTTYARICAGALRGRALYRHLRDHGGVGRRASRYIMTLADELPPRDPVEFVFIRRTGHPGARPPRAGEDPRVIRFDDFGQVAALAYALGWVEAEVHARVQAAVAEAGQGAAPLALLEQAQGRADPERLARLRQLEGESHT